MNCPACGLSEFSEKILSVEKDYSLPGYLYLNCSSCGSIYLSDDKIQSQVDLTKAHSEYWYKAGNFLFAPDKDIDTRISLAKSSALSIIDTCKLPNDIRILDIGCGNGELVAAFVEESYDAIGVEPDAKAFEASKVNPALKKRLISCGIEDLKNSNHPELNKPFDLIVLQNVLEHIYNPLSAIELLLNMLKDGGYIYIGVPSGESLAVRYLQANAWNFMAPFHRTLFTKKGFCRMIKRKALNVSLSFVPDNRHVWGSTRGIAYKASFSTEHAELRATLDGFSNYDFLVDELFDKIAVDFDMQPHLSFILQKKLT